MVRRARSPLAGLLVLAWLLVPGTQAGQRGQRSSRPHARAKPEVALPAASPAPPLAEGGAAVRLSEQPEGVVDQHLLALAGSPGAGFLAAFSDARWGAAEPFLRRFGPSGRPLADEAPLRPRPGQAVELELEVALGSAGHGLATWSLSDDPLGEGTFHTRPLEPTGELERPPEVVHARRGWVASFERAFTRDEADPLPVAVAIDALGRASLAFVHRGHVLIRDPEGRVERADPGGPPAVGPAQLVPGEARPRLVAWSVEGGVRAVGTGPRGGRALDTGPGRLVSAVADPRWPLRSWLLVELPPAEPMRTLDGDPWSAGRGALALRSVDLDRREGFADVALLERAPAHVELASWSPGLALLVAPSAPGQRSSNRTGGAPDDAGALYVHLYEFPLEGDTELAPGRTLPVPPPAFGGRALEAALASAGDSLLVVYGDQRDSGRRLFRRRLAAGRLEFEPERPLAAVERSSDQDRPAAASVGETRAAVVWRDASGSAPRLRARLVGAGGERMGPEFAIPAPTPDAPDPPGVAAAPRVSMGPAGDFLVTWDARTEWLCQAFHPDARPKRAPEPLGAGFDPERGRALTRQERYRSWLAAWCAPAGLRVQRIRGDGVPLAEPTAVAGASRPARPALLELFGERVVVAWEQPAGSQTTLRLRLLEPELQAATEVLAPPLPRGGSGAGPQLARAPRGGFLLAYEVQVDPRTTRYVAQRFDARAEAVGQPIALSDGERATAGFTLARLPDQSWAFAWERHSPSGPRLILRRLLPDRAEPGPERTLDPEASGRRVAPEGPVLAPLASGILGLWVDTRLGEGRDVWLRALPAAFDR